MSRMVTKVNLNLVGEPRGVGGFVLCPAFSMNLPDHLYSCLKYRDSMILTKEDRVLTYDDIYTTLPSIAFFKVLLLCCCQTLLFPNL